LTKRFLALFQHKASARHASAGVAILAAKDALRKANAVCFDVDSTVIQDEGIDVLADFKGVGTQVAELTKK
jgi:phosphoserine phosphatase